MVEINIHKDGTGWWLPGPGDRVVSGLTVVL